MQTNTVLIEFENTDRLKKSNRFNEPDQPRKLEVAQKV